MPEISHMTLEEFLETLRACNQLHIAGAWRAWHEQRYGRLLPAAEHPKNPLKQKEK